ncbi:hypothetical protein CKM354_000764000 [Cercospora kikuchii]|uniref:NHL repeat-containing protein n=1 Tax=Cercospora kikuchii TaxID=84275 RepID=A0A9P3CU84_9PEZI|nr:uncharacterized protein CKM354_000764000 [Cercospora kikuchii]GIZ44443.1 hypothetical protein CKM354_000764000 [Cercospora kikuchii]
MLCRLAVVLLAARALAIDGNDHLVYEAEGKPGVQARQTTDGRFTFYQMKTALSGPCDMAYNPVDRLLYGEQQFIDQLFSINPANGAVTEYEIPFTTGASNTTLPITVPKPVGDRTAFSCAIREGADGNIYASNGVRNQLVQLRTRDKRIRIFQNPPNVLGNLFPFNDIYTDAQGMWVTQTTGNVLQYFDYSQQRFTQQYTIPTPLSLPLGVFVASDGLVYGCEVIGNKIFTFNKRTKHFREYPLPVPLMTPSVVRAEKNGWVYFTLLTGNGMGRINMRSHKIELYRTNQDPAFGSVNTGPASDGRVWMSYFASNNRLAGFDDKTLTYTYVDFPGGFQQFQIPGLVGSIPPYLNIAVNYRPGNALWFSSPTSNAVGRYSLSNRRAKRDELVEEAEAAFES